MSVEDNRAHRVSQIAFLKKILILDCRGLSVMSKKGVFRLLCSFVQNGSKDLPDFCMSVEDNRVHRLSQIVFLKEFLILDYTGLSVVF